MDKDSLAQRIANLSPAKRALLELRLKKGAPVASEQTIPRLETHSSVPLSFAQQRLWFLNQLEPESAAYNQPKAIRLRGPLDVRALQNALDQIVARHEVLRTTFVSMDGVPMQVIAEGRSAEMLLIDLRTLPETIRESEAHRVLGEASRRPFDLSRDLMLRASLLCLGDEEHILLLVTHHIASDGWSAAILWKELTAFYRFFTCGEAPALRELPVQYVDYAAWQRNWLHGEVLDKQLSYWKKQLKNLPILRLPTDRPRPPLQTFRGAHQPLELSQSLSHALTDLSRREGVTLFMTLLAAFQALLLRCTGQDDVIVGAPIAGRTRPEIEGLIGFFVNALALRSDLSGNPSFRELLIRVREVALEAYAHQDLPFEKLVEELQPQRDLSHSPVFQVMFALQNAPRHPIELPGLALTPVEINGDTAKFDMTLSIRDETEGLRGWLEYNTDLFDDATISRLLEHFRTLLDAIVSNPEQRILDLPLLTAIERNQLLVEWNETDSGYPREKCVHELFESQVEQAPDTVAVVFADQQLAYRELNRRANQLARYLQKLGVQREILVGICMERSPEMIVSMLGVLKAGAAYVPLDPEYPKERLAFMLADTQASVLLTQQRFVGKLPDPRARVVCIDTNWKTIGQENSDNLSAGATADALAYVMYTSGSTGTPKGISIPHRAINRLVLNTNYVNLEPSDRVAQASNASFDAATFEIWGALLHGAQLIGITKDVALSPLAFSTEIREQGISTLFLTTALFNHLAAEAPESFRSVRHLLFGGEAVDPTWVKEVLMKGPPQRLLHVYGPTENTTFTSWQRVQFVPEGSTTIPIGRPIANTQIYLLDGNLQPVPIGVPGELCIAGDGLARDYHRQPELTAERFVPNPFGDTPGARMYRTGDLAKYLPDGNIEFLGRIDHQVKIRGFRIELGEIEAILGQHPAVQQNAVVAAEDRLSGRRLVAYVVPNQDQPPTINELRSALKAKLPEYMVPAAFVFLDCLPLTPNGKVDRQALPAPDPTRPALEHTFVAPRTPVESLLAKIWGEVLSLDKIGIHDNFFELGGHSLLAIRLVTEIEKKFGMNVPVAKLFQSPTIEQLADLLGAQKKSAASSLIAIQPQGSKPPFFCVHGYDGYIHLARYLGPDQPLYGLAQHLEGRKIRHIRIESIAAYYLDEVRAVQPAGPYLLGGHSIGGLIAFEMAQQLHRQGQEVALLALFDPGYPRSRKSLAAKFTDGAGRHFRNLSRLGLKGRLGYILRTAIARAEWNLKAMRCKAYHWMHISLPPKLQTFYVDEVVYGKLYIKSKNKYSLNPYPGPVTLFKAEDGPDNVQIWRAVATKGLEVHKIPGNHLNMIGEPGMSVLADQLKDCLNRAQASVLLKEQNLGRMTANSQAKNTDPSRGLDHVTAGELKV